MYVTGQRSLGPVGAARRAARLVASCRCIGRGAGPASPTVYAVSKSIGKRGVYKSCGISVKIWYRRRKEGEHGTIEIKISFIGIVQIVSFTVILLTLFIIK